MKVKIVSIVPLIKYAVSYDVLNDENVAIREKVFTTHAANETEARSNLLKYFNEYNPMTEIVKEKSLKPLLPDLDARFDWNVDPF